MSCHVVREQAAAGPPVLTLRAHPLRIALVGQPNVGKSVVFGRLTGRYVTVSNYPGHHGRDHQGPGAGRRRGLRRHRHARASTRSRATISEDERITRDVLASDRADLVVQVADARNLRRALMLTAQIAAFGKPTVLALNMVDEAFARGISIDAAALSSELGIPVDRNGRGRRAGLRRAARGAGAAAPCRTRRPSARRSSARPGRTS